MREIKYRYWYNNTKMIEVGSIQFFTDGTYIVNDELAGGVLLEYTGLKDKNGKEIYEGDIWNEKEVKFGQFYAYLENGLGDGYYITGFYIQYDDGVCEPVESGGEVIGNIYENPELLRV